MSMDRSKRTEPKVTTPIQAPIPSELIGETGTLATRTSQQFTPD